MKPKTTLNSGMVFIFKQELYMTVQYHIKKYWQELQIHRYIYDENINLIKKVEFEDTMKLTAFYHGYFYFKKIIYNWYDTESSYYKSSDGETFTEVDDKYEYYAAINFEKLYNGMEYSSRDFGVLEASGGYICSSENDISGIARELEEIKKGISDMSEYEYERNATDYKILLFTLRTRNGDNYESKNYISLDAVTTFELPEYAASFLDEKTVIWNDDTYIYFENKDDEEY